MYDRMIGTNVLFAGLMLETALGTDLERFGDYQTRLVKLNPKLGGEGTALPAPSTNNTPATAVPVTALSGSTLSGTALSGIPPADQTDAITPGNLHMILLFFFQPDYCNLSYCPFSQLWLGLLVFGRCRSQVSNMLLLFLLSPTHTHLGKSCLGVLVGQRRPL